MSRHGARGAVQSLCGQLWRTRLGADLQLGDVQSLEPVGSMWKIPERGVADPVESTRGGTTGRLPACRLEFRLSGASLEPTYRTTATA